MPLLTSTPADSVLFFDQIGPRLRDSLKDRGPPFLDGGLGEPQFLLQIVIGQAL
jgi:hypothetical protein